MSCALSIEHLTKRFPSFTLSDVSFSIPTGSVMGLIGENGAGKSTTMKLLLGLLRPDAGKLSILDLPLDMQPLEIKRRIGVVSEISAHPLNYRAQDLGRVLSAAYPKWSHKAFEGYLKAFDIDPHKKCGDLSKGTRTKLSIACALCHDAELLILDEPTSGLDPMVRNEVLDILREFMQDERHSILLSSHITSDLERIADYITFLHKGRVLFSESILNLNESYGIVRCAASMIKDFMPGAVLGVRKDAFSAEVLVNRLLLPTGLKCETASIDQIMLFLTQYATTAHKEGL